MLCPRCQTENPTGMKFCSQCAAPLGNQEESRFRGPESYTPRHLAEKILTSKAALEGERKQVAPAMRRSGCRTPCAMYRDMDMRFFRERAEGQLRQCSDGEMG
jgi:zinc-ribbon domain